MYVCVYIFTWTEVPASKTRCPKRKFERRSIYIYIYKLILVKKRYTYKPISIVHLYISLLYTWTGVPVSSTRWAERSFESRT